MLPVNFQLKRVVPLLILGGQHGYFQTSITDYDLKYLFLVKLPPEILNHYTLTVLSLVNYKTH